MQVSSDVRRLPVKHISDYTPLRKFYAWVGFVALLALFAAVIVGVIWANHYIDASLAAYHG